MTADEAINRIKEHIAIHRYNEPQAIHITEALQIAVDAMEKQIPKKPMKRIDPYNNSLYKLYCPTCGKYIANGNSRVGTLNVFTMSSDRCGFCGQAIDFRGDWTEDER